jgi:putative PIN family toxin of toxin-antitoxin system
MAKSKIIIDTNLWISLLIGKRLLEMRSLCNDNSVSVYMCEELKVEFLRIASREKIRKYTTAEHIEKTLELMEVSCIWSPIEDVVVSSGLRDAKDLYLLAFAETVKADYLLTGDKDLLVLQTHNQTKIMTYKEFETLVRR